MRFQPGRPKFAKGRKRTGEMNKTEARFEQTFLLPRMADGRITWYVYEKLTFKLADDTRYTPDFVAMASDDVLDCYECKGAFLMDANGRTKFKVAAEQFPLRFWFCKWINKTEGWEITSPYDEGGAAAPGSGESLSSKA